MVTDRRFMDSETGQLEDVLLCRPDHYSWIPSNDIAIQSMANGAKLDHVALKAQFDGLVALLRAEQVTCHFLTPHAGMPIRSIPAIVPRRRRSALL